MKRFMKMGPFFLTAFMLAASTQAADSLIPVIKEDGYNKKIIIKGIVDDKGELIKGLKGNSGSNTTDPLIVGHPNIGEKMVLMAQSDDKKNLYRSEISTESHSSSDYVLKFDHLYKIEFETIVDEYEKNTDEWQGSIFQVHAVAPTDWHYDDKKGQNVYDINWKKTTGSNPVSIGIKNGEYYAVINNIPRKYALGRAWWAPASVTPNDTEKKAGEVVEKTTVRWKIFLKPSAKNGVIEVWKNDSLITSYSGQNMDKMGVPGDRIKNAGSSTEFVSADDGSDANAKADAVVTGAGELTNHVYIKLGVYGGKGNGYRKIYYDNLKVEEMFPYPDFNRDGKADLLFQNIDDNKQVQIWHMDGAKKPENSMTIALAELPKTDTEHKTSEIMWRITGTGDFDGDGTPDLLWECMDEGWHALRVWLMTSEGQKKKEIIPTPSKNYEDKVPAIPGKISQSWRTGAIADMDADGTPDIVMQHATTGMVSIWLMKWTETGELKREKIENVKDSKGGYAGKPDWKIVGAGDVSGDGKPDLLLQKTSKCQEQNEAIEFWHMDGSKQAGIVKSDVRTGPGWRVVGFQDMDGDGNRDVVLQHINYIKIGWYLMGGTQSKKGTDFTINGFQPFLDTPYSARKWRAAGSSGAWVTEPVPSGCL